MDCDVHLGILGGVLLVAVLDHKLRLETNSSDVQGSTSAWVHGLGLETGHPRVLGLDVDIQSSEYLSLGTWAAYVPKPRLATSLICRA